MKLDGADFRVPPATAIDLDEWPTVITPSYRSKKGYRLLLAMHVDRLSALQQLHYASNRYALLLIFQAMDAAGKDGAIRHVMSGVNPQGCRVHSFKHPTPAEVEHDFLGRTTRDLPERKFFLHYLRKSSAGVSSIASMSPTRTGSSAAPTSRNGNSGAPT
jgi:polyphosphate kinase 2 (PPK2 family)